ncbi:MAG: glycoside hydrolase family 2 TIM barrel-domain containing protein, partial [Pseudomonadota bacterium]
MPLKPLALATLLTLTAGLPAHAGAAPAVVTLEQHESGWVLLRDGAPFEIHGAGVEFGDKAKLAARGGNSFRTWRTDNGQQTGQEVLDEALALGLMVVMCLDIKPERKGFDYDDEAAVRKQLEYAQGEVLKYKDHPALLAWMIGNEPNLFFENPKVFDAINEIAEMIDAADPNHPTTTALAGFSGELAELIESRAPALDFLSIQMYGDIVNLPRYLEETGFNKPYMVTEWGAIGHWEVATTSWEAPIEQNSTDKANNYLKSFETAIAMDGNLLGNYVFLWGQKQERTPTWYGMFLEDGASTAAVDTMEYLWTGEWPANRAPTISDIAIDGRGAADSVILSPGQTVTAMVNSADPEGAPLNWHWVLKEESQATQAGGDREAVPDEVPGAI